MPKKMPSTLDNTSSNCNTSLGPVTTSAKTQRRTEEQKKKMAYFKKVLQGRLDMADV